MSMIDIFFFFNDTATTEIYTLSLHDALPIFQLDVRTSTRLPCASTRPCQSGATSVVVSSCSTMAGPSSASPARSEEHTSELQSQSNLVCRLLLEKKNTTQ